MLLQELEEEVHGLTQVGLRVVEQLGTLQQRAGRGRTVVRVNGTTLPLRTVRGSKQEGFLLAVGFEIHSRFWYYKVNYVQSP
jgi:hypothetical protein